MQNKKWKTFNKLTAKCYNNMIRAEADGNCWQQAFELLKEIVREERQNNEYSGVCVRAVRSEGNHRIND